MILSSSIDYLSIEGMPWILVAWAGLYAFRPFATLIHEIGHFAMAFLFTKSSLVLSIGNKEKNYLYEGKRVQFSFSLRNGQVGQTTYCAKSVSSFARFLILLGGPLLSLGMSCLTGWLTLSSTHPIWLEIAGVSWFCANSLAFIRSALPMRLKPTEEFPTGPPSDGLQLLWLLSGKELEEDGASKN